VTIATLAILLGLSMLVVLSLEFLVIRRVPRLARMLGTQTATRS